MQIDLYGFREPPFLMTPDTRLFFPSAGHSRAYAHLMYGLAQREGCRSARMARRAPPTPRRAAMLATGGGPAAPGRGDGAGGRAGDGPRCGQRASGPAGQGQGGQGWAMAGMTRQRTLVEAVLRAQGPGLAAGGAAMRGMAGATARRHWAEGAGSRRDDRPAPPEGNAF